MDRTLILVTGLMILLSLLVILVCVLRVRAMRNDSTQFGMLEHDEWYAVHKGGRALNIKAKTPRGAWSALKQWANMPARTDTKSLKSQGYSVKLIRIK